MSGSVGGDWVKEQLENEEKHQLTYYYHMIQV